MPRSVNFEYFTIVQIFFGSQRTFFKKIFQRYGKLLKIFFYFKMYNHTHM